MRKREWLLLFVGISGPDRTEIPPIDPVRVMKGLFLFGQQVELPPDERYHFVPYLYGPCSFEIYRDLDGLVEHGLIAEEKPWGRSWNLYRPTAQGRRVVQEIAAKIPASHLEGLAEIKRYVLSVPFNKLLRDVYREYPEYATNSVFSPRDPHTVQ